MFYEDETIGRKPIIKNREINAIENKKETWAKKNKREINFNLRYKIKIFCIPDHGSVSKKCYDCQFNFNKIPKNEKNKYSDFKKINVQSFNDCILTKENYENLKKENGLL